MRMPNPLRNKLELLLKDGFNQDLSDEWDELGLEGGDFEFSDGIDLWPEYWKNHDPEGENPVPESYDDNFYVLTHADGYFLISADQLREAEKLIDKHLSGL